MDGLCPHGPTLDDVKIGMKREQALRSVNAAPFSFEQGTTEYLIYQVVASFTAMYRDNPNSVLFVRLEKGVVVDKGVVGRSEEARIQRINPAFDLEAYQRN